MSDLRLVGLSDDGSRLILEEPDGSESFLPVDERIHAALRGDRARLGQVQIEMDSKLRPKEIQARIRAGQSLEEVARIAGVPADRVMRYAGPILHEREHIAQEAAKAGVKSDDHGAVMLLGELIAERLEERGIPRESMSWDAWRRDDGGWEVRLDYQTEDDERSALWVYDPVRRIVTPDDDDARWLLEERPGASVTPLRSVSNHSQKSADPAPQEADSAHADDAVDQQTALADQLFDREDPTDADQIAAVSHRTAPTTPMPSPREKAIEAANRSRKHTVPDTASPSRKRRAAVPSWDEILFGSRKPE